MSNSLTDLTSFSDALVQLVSQTSPSVVTVTAGAYRTVSGIAMDANHIAVPDHSLRRKDEIPVITANGTKASAKVLGRDPGVDLAILWTDSLPLSPLPAAENLKAGMLAAVIGMTADVGASVSLGILGAVGEKRRTWRGGTLDRFLRLDVNLYPSQTGAAVVDSQGSLIGMATPALSRHSTMAVSVPTMLRTIQELQKEGRIKHGYLGVGVQPVNIPIHLREKLPDAAESGLILLSAVPSSPAAQAGLQVGDILISLDGRNVSDVEELQSLLRGAIVGHAVEALLLRGGEPLSVSITIQEAPSKSRPEAEKD
jgi:S1-C subfamily serine protease